jgi:glycosyltransferase involved in cell wall biosynthesis
VHVIAVIPALNEAGTIAQVVRDVGHYAQPLVVDDGSTDETADLARSAGAEVVELPQNLGYEGALDAGFSRAGALGADVVVTFDADSQFAAELIAEVSAPIIANDADIVFGERGEYARISERIFALYTQLRFNITDALCGVKAYRMVWYHRYGRFDSGRSVGTELALHAVLHGARYTVVSTPVRPRESGNPRFGQGLRANLRILTAMLDGMYMDLRSKFQRT